jgi:hypothetical protein
LLALGSGLSTRFSRVGSRINAGFFLAAGLVLLVRVIIAVKKYVDK